MVIKGKRTEEEREKREEKKREEKANQAVVHMNRQSPRDHLLVS